MTEWEWAFQTCAELFPSSDFLQTDAPAQRQLPWCKEGIQKTGHPHSTNTQSLMDQQNFAREIRDTANF